MKRDGVKQEWGEYKFQDAIIKYQVLRSARRRKTIGIRLDSQGEVRVAAPVRVSKKRLLEVVAANASWIVRKLSERAQNPGNINFSTGDSIPYLGKQARLTVDPAEGKRASVQFHHWSFHVALPGKLNKSERSPAVIAALKAWFRERAQERLPLVVESWAPIIGRQPTRVLVRDQKSRWGSCASDGSLRFNLRLMFMAPELIEYVVVHELLHLEIHNHSNEFWDSFTRIMPERQGILPTW